MRRAGVIVCIAVAASILVWSPSAAGSCGSPGVLRERVDDADAAIVGTVEVAGVPDPDAATNDLGPPLRWTLDVERDIKENVGRTVTFHAGREGSFVSGQFAASEGERLGLLLHRDSDGWRTSMCDVVDAGDVQAAAFPLSPARGRGLPLLLATGAFGAPRVALLDERGDFTAFGNGEGEARIAVCPEERFFAEAVWDDWDEASPATVEIRDARTMRVVRREALPKEIGSAAWRQPRAIACRDEQGTDVLVAAEAGGRWARVVRRSGDTWKTLFEGNARAVTFTRDGFTVIRYRGDDPELASFRDDGRETTRVDGLPSFTSLSVSESVPFVADVTGRFVAGANEERTSGDNLFIADLERERITSVRVPWVEGLAWSDDELIATHRGGTVRVFDTRLREKSSWKKWTGSTPVAVVGERLYGARGGTIVSAEYRTGSERAERGLGEIGFTGFVVLSGERELAERREANPTWAVYGVVLAVLILGAIVWRSRRASREEG